jgi:hypothetical protein
MKIDDIQLLLSRELESFAKEIEMFPDDETVWVTVAGISNSAGNLALHICGNLKHYVGSIFGGSGYVRNRELEFSTRAGSRKDLISEIRSTIEVVTDILPRLSERTLAEVYPEKVGGNELPCHLFLLHLCTHTAFHLGQAGYLRRIITKENQSSGGISLQALKKTATPKRR